MPTVPSWKNCKVLLICLVALASGCKATPPGKFATYTMTRAKRWFLVPNRHEPNPIAFTPENVARGKESFSRYCISCHGLDAQNDGVAFANRLSPPVPSLASADVQAYSDGQLKWIIDNGLWPSGMPGSPRSPDRATDLVHHCLPTPTEAKPRFGYARGRARRPSTSGNLRRLASLRALPRRHLSALEKDAHGQCGA